MPDMLTDASASPMLAETPPCRANGRQKHRCSDPKPSGLGSVLALQMAHMLLSVEFEPDALDQVKLRLEKVDVMLLVLHHALEHVARDVVLGAMAVGSGFLVKRARAVLGGEIALEDFFDVLPDPQGVEHLHVREAVEE